MHFASSLLQEFKEELKSGRFSQQQHTLVYGE